RILRPRCGLIVASRTWPSDGLRGGTIPVRLLPMERLPYIDEHRRRVAATPERTWDAVVQLARGRLSRPAPAAFAALWRLEPASGFAVAEEIAPRHLALRGRHRFSRYELAFNVDPGPDGVTLSARTCAVFPGDARR